MGLQYISYLRPCDRQCIAPTIEEILTDHRKPVLRQIIVGQSGMVGFDAIFNNAKTAGVNYLIAEIEQYSVPVEESVKVSLDYLLDAPFVKKSYSK